MTENLENTSVKLERDEKGRLLPGQQSLNPEGRPKGSPNFDTYWKQAVKKIAEEENISDEEAEVNMLIAAYKQAKRGNSAYFKEIMDRKFGKVKQELEHSGEIGVKPIYDASVINE